jgi:ABC-type phosphate transport system substrate-binding protein
VNKCFCTRRNPISISAAAIYLACQLEDKRKTQAEICKVTGLTEVTLRKVYKELLENWDDLLPPNYTPATPPEKAFPMTAAFYSGRASIVKSDAIDPQFGSGNDQGFDLNKSDKTEKDVKMGNNERWMNQLKENSTSASGSGLAAGAGSVLGSGPSSGKKLPNPWQFKGQAGVSGSSSYNRFGEQQLGPDFAAAFKGIGRKNSGEDAEESGRK